MASTYQDLKVWQKSVSLVVDIYRQTKTFPQDEQYGLTSQLRRAAVSIPSNIAEGQGRRCEGDFQKFLRTARGSLLELETQVVIAGRLGYLSPAAAKGLLTQTSEIGRMLNGLMSAIASPKTAAAA